MNNIDRTNIYKKLRAQLEEVGFIFQNEQIPYMQKRHDPEYKFIKPSLTNQFEKDAYRVRGHKYYLKPLSNDADAIIGLVKR
tara:strand:- start:1514 stop:1759 length:246 start_codon:yes stop_codon:yes gene_type:complete